MKFYVLSVRDRAADVFGQPFVSVNIDASIRSFADEVNNPNSSTGFSRHPDDYDLYLLGEYVDSDGSFQTHSPKQIAIGKDLVRTPK